MSVALQISAPPVPPGLGRIAGEAPRLVKDMLSLTNCHWREQLKKAAAGNGQPVMTLPGFGGGDGSMALLRRYLNSLGYRAEPWRLGTNLVQDKVQTLDEVLAFCATMEAAIVENAQRIADNCGEKVSLVGWSLGGVYANSIAQTHPELIRQVILLGSPVGDPRGTSVWGLMKKVMRGEIPDHLQNVDAWIERRDQLGGRRVRTSVLYSKYDGAVAEDAVMIENDKLVENIHVASSHVGFSHNASVYWTIADRLNQSLSNWKPFDYSVLPKNLQKNFVS